MNGAGASDASPAVRRRRVVVTGLGVVSCVGVGRDAFRDALRAGTCAVTPITSFDVTGYPYAHAAEVQNLGPLQTDYDVLIKRHGRSASLATLAAREAVEDAGVDDTLPALADAGVVLGTTNGESQLVDSLVRGGMLHGQAGIPTESFIRVATHRLAEAVADDLGFQGDHVVLATACAAGNYAIGYAADIIAAGEAEMMLCGGVDSVCRQTYSGFFRVNAVTPDVCRPFDADRNGILTGEGAAVLLLETLDHALARGARIYAEVLGYATNCDAHHMVSPERGSIANCIKLAHARAGIEPGEVDFISAHGTGTRVNDVVEVGAIRDVFGDTPPPTISIKSMIGHTMGAASAMGAIASILGMAHDFIPPTVNFRTPDAECLIDCVPNVSRPQRISIVQNHGFAFGGNNAIMLLRNGREVTQ